jgi:hypothetical protein
MRVRAALPVVLVPVGIFAGTFLIRYFGQDNPDTPAPAGVVPAEVPAAQESARPHQPTPVALNRGPEVRDGFRGDIHPLLSGHTRLTVTAEWTPVGTGRDHFETAVPAPLYAAFMNLQPAQAQRIYTERDFSGFLPEAVGEVGQLWALDPGKIVEILKQFHPRPSLQLVSAGRRAGPDGAFAILRAVSPSYLDIVFRIHAEFSLMPEPPSLDQPHFRAWYTPAYFAGRVLVNRKTGTVDHFRLALPTDKALNVHLTHAARGMGKQRQPHDVVRVERMELTGGDGDLVENIAWTKALSRAEADRRLAKVFYKFLEIDWVPFDQVAARSRSGGKPIFAVVSWGAFEDQSC